MYKIQGVKICNTFITKMNLTLFVYLFQKQKYSKPDLEKVINSTYPVLNEDVLHLIVHFIEYKKQKGSIIER